MAQEKWNIDTSHSHVGFSVKHMVFAKVRGEFKTWSGAIEIDGPAFETAQVTAKIDVSSIDTHEEKRDGHLKSPDFFDTAKHPEMTFKSTQVKKVSDSEFTVKGKLDLHGVSKDIDLKVEFLGRGKDPWGNERLAFHADASLDRRDFGLVYNQALETGGLLVGEKITIEIDAELVKA